ncbi:MAG TPA: IS630 family transposase [Anaerolineales bacterium]|nr:IS630 family transposase [Anaerolineales bacterium]
MRTKYHIHLSKENRQELETLIHSGESSARTQTRARILLLTDESQKKKKGTEEIASALMCSLPTITNIRRKFVEGGLENALYDKPRPGAIPKITGEIEAQLILLACSAPPEGRSRWTLQLLADKLVELKLVDSISDVAVNASAKKNELKPWLVKSWVIAKPSAQFVAKMEDVLAVYERPYDPKRPLVCVDEASKTLHDTPRGAIPIEAGQPPRQDYEYERNGTANIFMAVEPLMGKRKTFVTDQRTNQDFAELLRYLSDEEYPDAEKIVLVTDNLNTHSPACLYERFEPAEARRLAQRFEWHYTPEHGSWLNMAEIELSILSRQCTNRRIPDKQTLAKEVAAWERDRTNLKAQINWQFKPDNARIKLKRLYPVTIIK